MKFIYLNNYKVNFIPKNRKLHIIKPMSVMIRIPRNCSRLNFINSIFRLCFSYLFYYVMWKNKARISNFTYHDIFYNENLKRFYHNNKKKFYKNIHFRNFLFSISNFYDFLIKYVVNFLV